MFRSVDILPESETWGVAVYFETATNPGCIFGYRLRDVPGWFVRNEMPVDSPHAASFLETVLMENVQEQISADDLGLPADCRPGTITWITE